MVALFRKDYDRHKENPKNLTHKRLMVGAGINTHDYKDAYLH